MCGEEVFRVEHTPKQRGMRGGEEVSVPRGCSETPQCSRSSLTGQRPGAVPPSSAAALRCRPARRPKKIIWVDCRAAREQ